VWALHNIGRNQVNSAESSIKLVMRKELKEIIEKEKISKIARNIRFSGESVC
jgi:hypothetical protein